ncbi:MAG TPA: MobC family plasmid mobilization relaxosome protein [Magnetospirillaceae bacterium]|jgi:hypothetical protein
MTDEDGPKRSRRGSETRKKSIPVTSRYDAQEFAELEERASEAGLTRASYQREKSLTAPVTRSTRRAPIDRELLAKTQGQLGKVGSNLNQIARAANVGEIQLAEIRAAVAEVRALVRVIQEALGQRPLSDGGDNDGRASGSLPLKPNRPNYAALQPEEADNGQPKPKRPDTPVWSLDDEDGGWRP